MTSEPAYNQRIWRNDPAYRFVYSLLQVINLSDVVCLPHLTTAGTVYRHLQLKDVTVLCWNVGFWQWTKLSTPRIYEPSTAICSSKTLLYFVEMSASDSEQSSVPQEYTKTRVEKAQKAKSKAVHSSKLSAKQRLRQGNNSEHFYVDGDTLFCKTCAVSIDYSRQSCLEQHLKTQLHEKNAKSEVPAKKQKTLTTTLPVENTAKLAKLKVVTDYVRVLVSTNTPFNTVDNEVFREFCKKHIVGGGSIPKRTGLARYLDDLYAVEVYKLKE